jgi:hypothetical protein
MRTRALPRIAAAAITLALALAGPAMAQQAPTLGAPPTPDQTPTTAQATTSGTGGGGLATWQEALIFAAGLILIGGIAFAILGDARERAQRIRGAETDPATAPHRHRQRSKQRARAKGKAARAQRRRNR